MGRVSLPFLFLMVLCFSPLIAQRDIHTANWHGQTATIAQMRTDMAMLNPMTSVIADMVPDEPGIWLLHCHMPGHAIGGMKTRFQVLAK